MAEIPNTLVNRAHIIAARERLPVEVTMQVLTAAAALDDEIRLAVTGGQS